MVEWALRLHRLLLFCGVSVLVLVLLWVGAGVGLCEALWAWREAARGHLDGRGLWVWSLRLHGVGHHLVGQRGGVGGERGGERRALHDPIF